MAIELKDKNIIDYQKEISRYKYKNKNKNDSDCEDTEWDLSRNKVSRFYYHTVIEPLGEDIHTLQLNEYAELFDQNVFKDLNLDTIDFDHTTINIEYYTKNTSIIPFLDSDSILSRTHVIMVTKNENYNNSNIYKVLNEKIKLTTAEATEDTPIDPTIMLTVVHAYKEISTAYNSLYGLIRKANYSGRTPTEDELREHLTAIFKSIILNLKMAVNEIRVHYKNVILLPGTSQAAFPYAGILTGPDEYDTDYHKYIKKLYGVIMKKIMVAFKTKLLFDADSKDVLSAEHLKSLRQRLDIRKIQLELNQPTSKSTPTQQAATNKAFVEMTKQLKLESIANKKLTNTVDKLTEIVDTNKNNQKNKKNQQRLEVDINSKEQTRLTTKIEAKHKEGIKKYESLNTLLSKLNKQKLTDKDKPMKLYELSLETFQAQNELSRQEKYNDLYEEMHDSNQQYKQGLENLMLKS